MINLLTMQPNISTVCRMMGISPGTVYKHMKADDDFKGEINDALEIGYDTLEEEAIRRARDGIVKPVYFQGEHVADTREYSDSLLKELLRAYKPRKFNPGSKLTLDNKEKVHFTINMGPQEE